MKSRIRVLLSNISLPTSDIGSWTTRMTYFINRNPDFFDFILSPHRGGENSIFCKKRPFLTWRKNLRKVQLLNWVCADYIRQIKKLSKNYDELVIVVMDDPHLIEAIGIIKKDLESQIELVFSFHGFDLALDKRVINSIDKILFLSKMSYEVNKNNSSNYPQGVIVGNAIDSEVFFPLDLIELKNQRHDKGYSELDCILIWMANDRPKKGFHIFKKIVLQLLIEDPELKVLLIGTNQTINHPNVTSVGRVSNSVVASYLQLGNYYMFTTLYNEGFGLSMVEAYKCGNIVMASHLGAIPEVLNEMENTYLVENPKDKDNWIRVFNMVKNSQTIQNKRLNKKRASAIWNYDTWESKFKNAIK